jgi:anti-sigma-K factor RskA
VPPAQAPIVVVLGANPAAAQALNASFVASVSADGRALVLRPLGEVSLTAGRALELWAVPAKGAPRSLGLVQASGATTLLRAQLLSDTAAFAVSVEPAGGSTTGAPTGPIVSVGKLQT